MSMIPMLKFGVFHKDDWTKILQNHICNTLKKPECWQNCVPLITSTMSLRNEFDFESMNKNLKVDASWLIKLAKMEELIRNVNFLSSRFKFGKGNKTVEGFSSKWTGSLTRDNYQSSHIRFESINFTYNYANVNFNLAMSEIKDTSKMADCLKRLRAAAWGISETMKYTSMLRGVMKLPFEFSDENLGYMHAMMTGMAYLCMFKAFSANPEFAKDDMKMASLLKEVHGWFNKCKIIYENSNTVRKYQADFHRDVLWNFYKYSYLAITHCITGLMAKHELEVTKGHLGVAICYMHQLESMMQIIDKDKYMKKEDKKELANMYVSGHWKQTTKDTIEKNNKVYQFNVPNPGELKVIPEWEKQITEQGPCNIYVPPEGYQHYQNFMSEELEKIDSN